MKTVKNTLFMAFFVMMLLNNKTATAQQDPHYSMYMFNPLAINPGYAGSRDALSITALHRNQWVNFEGSPRTQTLSIHSPLYNELIGLGFSVVNDKIGANKSTGFFGDLAYRLKLNKQNDKLAFGINGGLDLYSSDFSSLLVADPSDEVYYTPVSNKLLPNCGFGLYYSGKKHYIGVSVPRLLTNKLSGQSSTILAKQSRHLFLTAGYVFKINSTIDFKPSFAAKMTSGAPLSLDANASFLFYDKLWLGAMYRIKESVGFNVVFNLNQYLKLGYAYDYTLTDISTYSSGSHEVMLGVDLKSRAKSYKTPRYF